MVAKQDSRQTIHSRVCIDFGVSPFVPLPWGSFVFFPFPVPAHAPRGKTSRATNRRSVVFLLFFRAWVSSLIHRLASRQRGSLSCVAHKFLRLSLSFFFSTVVRGQGLSWVVDPIGFFTPRSRIFDPSRSSACSFVFSCDPGRRGDGFQFPRALVRGARVTMRPPCPTLEMRPPLFFSSFFLFFLVRGDVSLPFDPVLSPHLSWSLPHPPSRRWGWKHVPSGHVLVPPA